jgi:hypothetical protein
MYYGLTDGVAVRLDGLPKGHYAVFEKNGKRLLVARNEKEKTVKFSFKMMDGSHFNAKEFFGGAEYSSVEKVEDSIKPGDAKAYVLTVK